MKSGVRNQEPEAGRDASRGVFYLGPGACLLNPWFRLPLLCALSSLSLFVVGCVLKASPDGIPPEAQAAIDVVSNDINDGHYEKIYNEAAEEW